MGRRSNDYAHGLTDRESEVIDRADAGMPPAQIAREVGVRRSYVDQLIRQFAISCTAEQRWVQAAQDADQRFRVAIAVSGGRFA